MVRTELAVFAPGTTDAGANEHFKLMGSPEHVNITALLNEPAWGVRFTVEVPDPPLVMVIAGGVALRVRLGLSLEQLSFTCTPGEI